MEGETLVSAALRETGYGANAIGAAHHEQTFPGVVT